MKKITIQQNNLTELPQLKKCDGAMKLDVTYYKLDKSYN